MFAHAQCLLWSEGHATEMTSLLTKVLLRRRRNGKHVDDLMGAHRIRKHGAFGYPKCGLMFKRNAEISSQFVSFPNSATQPVPIAQKLHTAGQTKLDLEGSDWVNWLFYNTATGNLRGPG